MRLPVVALAVSLLAVPALAKSKNELVVPIKTATGDDAGTASFHESKGKLVVKLNLKNLPFGDHGVHIHAKPACDAPDFKTAGGHFNPEGKQHGFLNAMGHHAGDMPSNVTVGEDHTAQVTFKLDYLTMDPGAANSIFANGGTSIVIHEKADDEKTDPSGNSGNRIACGVIAAPTN